MGIFGWSLPPGCSSVPGDEDGAVELVIDGVWYALDDSNNVYQMTNSPQSRDDGYEKIGVLNIDPSDDFEEHWQSRLRSFVTSYKAGRA